MRTYQTVPSTSRSRVTRRPTASTVPVASPRSTTSPTPYWSSNIMNMPDRKSFTSFWAPKPRATPRTPALARIGRDVVAELGQHHDHQHGEHDRADDALEQGAHGAGPLRAAGRDRAGASRLLRRWPSRQRVGQHAGLGAPYDAVDQPVQEPAHHEREHDQPDDARAARRSARSGPRRRSRCRPVAGRAGAGRSNRRVDEVQETHASEATEPRPRRPSRNWLSCLCVTHRTRRTLGRRGPCSPEPPWPCVALAAPASADTPSSWERPRMSRASSSCWCCS